MTWILALGLALQASEPKAEAAYRRIEARLRESKTLALTYRSSLGESLRVRGALHWAEGGKLSLDCRMSSTTASVEWPILAVSDGRRTRLKLPTVQWVRTDRPADVRRERAVSDMDTPPDFRERMIRQLVAFGFSGLALPRRDEHLLPDAEGRPVWRSSPYDLPWNGLEAREFRGPRSEDDFETLQFKVKLEGLEPLYEVKLWYDPKTFRLAKRRLSLSKTALVLMESYDSWTLDGEIPPDKFAPPPGQEGF